jgi:hypothetical protein
MNSTRTRSKRCTASRALAIDRRLRLNHDYDITSQRARNKLMGISCLQDPSSSNQHTKACSSCAPSRAADEVVLTQRVYQHQNHRTNVCRTASNGSTCHPPPSLCLWPALPSRSAHCATTKACHQQTHQLLFLQQFH